MSSAAIRAALLESVQHSAVSNIQVKFTWKALHTGAAGGSSASRFLAFQRINRKGNTYGGHYRHNAAID